MTDEVLQEMKFFTVVFEGDIKALPFNPLKVESPYGRPVTCGAGHAFAEIDMIQGEVSSNDKHSDK